VARSPAPDDDINFFTEEIRHTTTLATILRSEPVIAKLGGSKVINLVSMDIEGHEIFALEGFPWEEFCVEVWCVELIGGDFSRAEAIITFFLHRNYNHFASIGADGIFVRREPC
jgi:hypothetical protein